MDRELTARSSSKLPLVCEPPPGTCHMRYQVSFTCSSDMVEDLATWILRKRLLQRTGHWKVTGSRHRTSLSPQSNEDQGLASAGRAQSKKLRQSFAQHPSNRLAASSLNRNNHRSHWRTSPVGLHKGKRVRFAGTPKHGLPTQEGPHAMTEIDIASDQGPHCCKLTDKVCRSLTADLQ